MEQTPDSTSLLLSSYYLDNEFQKRLQRSGDYAEPAGYLGLALFPVHPVQSGGSSKKLCQAGQIPVKIIL